MAYKTNYVDENGQTVTRKKCGFEGCNRFRPLHRRLLENGKIRVYELCACTKHLKNLPQRLKRKVHPREVAWKRNGLKLTIERYDELLLKQGNRCAICGTHQSELKIALAVDHDHETGEIRGLLCSRCNINLGCAEAIGLKKITKYLHRNITNTVFVMRAS